MCLVSFCFFFSSRRRHTRYWRDWSSDVCSSDLRDPTPGMMWDAWWSGEWAKGPDGKCLVVVCPNGSQWMIDGPASNCTMKDDQGPYGVAHRCWTDRKSVV